MTMLCPMCREPMSEKRIRYECCWFFKKQELPEADLLCPQCRQQISGGKMCDACGCFYEKQVFTIADLYNYNARPQNSYHKFYNFKEVLEQIQGREGKQIGLNILCQIRFELPIFSEATAIDAKTDM